MRGKALLKKYLTKPLTPTIKKRILGRMRELGIGEQLQKDVWDMIKKYKGEFKKWWL